VSTQLSGESERRSNRRDEILRAAGDLFHSRGYAGVTLDQIAAVLGISGPAIYRHFAGKQALLIAAVDEAVSLLERAVAGADAGDRFIGALARLASGSSHFGSMIDREIRHVDDDARAGFERRIDAVFEVIADALDADPPAAAYLARAMVAVASSSSFSRSASLDAFDADVILRPLRVLADWGDLTRGDLIVAPSRGESMARDWLPRSEAILAALPKIAIDRGGIGAVTLEAVGASAGIAGPSVYNYFGSKADVWQTWLARAANWSISSLQQSLANSHSPADVMWRALAGYVELTASSPAISIPFDPSDPSIQESTRQQFESIATEYYELWLLCAQTARPELDPREAETLFLASHAVINRARTLSAPVAVPAAGPLTTLAAAAFFA
jgi:AcrR family transcriptional regulator